MSINEKEYSKGYWMSARISIGIAIGVALGLLFDNIGIGIAIGIAIGSGIGESVEQKHKDNIRPLSERERARQRRGVVAGLILTFLAPLGALILLLRGK